MHKINTYFSKVKGVGSASLDRGISIVIASVVLAAIAGGVSWLYNQYTYKKFINDFSMYSIAIQEYYEGTSMLSGNSTAVPINLENIKKAKLLPENQNVSRLAKYSFVANAYRDRILYIVSPVDKKLCYSITQASRNKTMFKISYLENVDTNVRLIWANFFIPSEVNTFCETVTNLRIAENLRD